jgi:hypothetical protein
MRYRNKSTDSIRVINQDVPPNGTIDLSAEQLAQLGTIPGALSKEAEEQATDAAAPGERRISPTIEAPRPLIDPHATPAMPVVTTPVVAPVAKAAAKIGRR